MTNIGDLLGEQADIVARNAIAVGDVHILALTSKEGITPKNEQSYRNKYFVVLGFDTHGNVIGGVVVNSKVNSRLASIVRDYHLPVTTDECPFLEYNSFVNCSHLIPVSKDKFNNSTFVGKMKEDTMILIVGAVKECPLINKQQLKEFGII